MASRYDLRGVSADKSDVHAAIEGLDKGLFPNAFCKILPDVSGGDPAYCNLMHADTAGTKTSLAYLYWRETGDLSVWRGIAQDAIVMNLDDMGCVGCVDNIILSSTIGRNKQLISADVLRTLIRATSEIAEELRSHGIGVYLAGGETADVGDIVRTADVGYTAFGRMRRDAVIDIAPRPGDVLVGLASYGQASYETTYNGGMGSNGLTSARHDVFSRYYAEQYPESFDPAVPQEVVYSGSRRLTDRITVDGRELTVGELVLSPTRTYLPVIKRLLDENHTAIRGMIHCSGGGQTKVGKFLHGIRVVKDRLFPTPPLFELIRTESGTAWREMYQVFNMGHRREVFVAPEHADWVIETARSFAIDARIVGRAEASDRAEVVIESAYGTFTYQD